MDPKQKISAIYQSQELEVHLQSRCVASNLARYKTVKLQRWAMFLSMYKYDNVLGILLSRWVATRENRTVRTVVRQDAVEASVTVWPTMVNIHEAHRKYI